MGLHAVFTLIIPEPKSLKLAKMVEEVTGAKEKYSETVVTSLYKDGSLTVNFRSSTVMGSKLDDCIHQIAKNLNTIGEDWYIQVTSNWYNL